MASISKTPNGKFKARVRIKGVSMSQTFSARHSAETWGKRMERELEHDIAIGYAQSKLKRMTLEEVCIKYLEQWNGKDNSHPGRVQWWIDRLGSRRLIDIDKRLIRKELDKYGEGKAEVRTRDGKIIQQNRIRSGASINRKQMALSAVYEWAIENLDLPKNPVRKIKARKESRGCERFLRRDECGRLLEACKDSRWDRLHLLVLMALNTGARRGELGRITWGHIDWKHKTALLEDTKEDAPRVLTLSDEVIVELRRFHAADLKERVRIFHGRHPMHPRSFDREFKKAVQQAGVAPLRFHDLRHTAASLMAQDGINLHQIQDVLGHRRISATQRYAHLTVESKRNVTDEVLVFDRV